MENFTTKEELLRFISDQVIITNNYIKTLREFENKVKYLSSLPNIPFFKSKIELTKDEFDNMMKRRINEFNFSCRVLNAFREMEVETVEHLLKSDRMNFLRLSRFGKKSLMEISNFIETYNFSEHIKI